MKDNPISYFLAHEPGRYNPRYIAWLKSLDVPHDQEPPRIYLFTLWIRDQLTALYKVNPEAFYVDGGENGTRRLADQLAFDAFLGCEKGED